MPTHGSPALTHDPQAGKAWSHLIFLDRHLLQTSTARASGFVPFESRVSAVAGELRAFSDLRLAGLADVEVDGPTSLEKPPGSPFEPEFVLAMLEGAR